MLTLANYSFGVGDRFAHQAQAQLRACVLAAEHGAEVVPVWNKSNREHLIVGSEPASVRAAADAAVRELGWTKPYHVDADHIRLDTVDRFIGPSDFFTIDVADSIGQPAEVAAGPHRADVDAGVEEVVGEPDPVSEQRSVRERARGVDRNDPDRQSLPADV